MTIKKNVSVDDAIKLLNDALKKDREAVSALVVQRVECNEKLADHPSIQVIKKDTKDSQAYTVGLLGVFNGLFGTDRHGYGAITVVVADNDKKGIKKGQVVKFRRTKGYTP